MVGEVVTDEVDLEVEEDVPFVFMEVEEKGREAVGVVLDSS